VLFVFEGQITIRHSADSISHRDGLAEACTPKTPGLTTYGIIVCQACKKLFVAEKKYGEWESVYPIMHEPVSQDIPEPMRGELEEANLCFAVGAYRGCLLLCRTALIDLQRHEKVSNLKELKDKGDISDLLYRQADEVRLWANLVGHEVIVSDVAEDDCEELLNYLGAILDAVYVQPAQLATLTQKRNALKKNTEPNSKTSNKSSD
jgi:hypothetical protein